MGILIGSIKRKKENKKFLETFSCFAKIGLGVMISLLLYFLNYITKKGYLVTVFLLYISGMMKSK